jgi:pilus assembly protein CpaE
VSRVPVFCDPDPTTARLLCANAGADGAVFTDLSSLRDHLTVSFDEDTIVLGPAVGDGEAFAAADYLRVNRPHLGVVLVRAQVDTQVLQEALRAGVREVVHYQDSAGLAQAVARSAALTAALREQVPPASAPPAKRPHGRVVTVFSAKGGCGKTTLATNLSAALADKGRRQVCLVDLDLAFGDVAISMQLYPARTIADALPLNGAIDAAAVQAMLTRHSPGLDALVAPLEPTTADAISPSLVTRLLEVLREEFDYVVVDTPPTFDDIVLAALDLSDLIALIATLDIPAIKNVKVALETLDELNYPRDRIRLVLNRADSKVGLAVSEVEKSLRTTICAQIPSSRDVPAAINRGIPIYLDDPKHPVSLAIRAFADSQVLAHPEPVHGSHEGPRGAGVGRPAPHGDRRGLIRKRRNRAS